MDEQLPIPGSYHGKTSPSRSRLQVQHSAPRGVRAVADECLILFCPPALEPAQSRLPAQQRFLHVIRFLGKHGSSWLHSSSGNNSPLGPQGEAHLHPHDAGGRSHGHKAASVDRWDHQPPSWKPPWLVPDPGQNLQQHEDPTGQPGIREQRKRRRPRGVGACLFTAFNPSQNKTPVRHR